jgi:protein subunit release factor B
MVVSIEVAGASFHPAGHGYTAIDMSQPNDHPAATRPEQLLAECEARRLRRSGPGGQHRNKVETAVSLRHLPTGVCAEANERRSQAQNRSTALFRLRVNLALVNRWRSERRLHNLR